MQNYLFENVLLDSGWQRQVRVQVDSKGIIHEVASVSRPNPNDIQLNCVIPAMPNCHSHVFQRTMAGLTEYKTSDQDSFWSWRDLMYKYANKINDQQLYDIARYCYSEMLETGYASVCEFHYIHRDLDDQSDVLNMSKAILNAANDVGIGLTFLPVLYTQAHIDGSELSDLQQRFKLSTDEYIKLYRQIESELLAGQNLGICFHSLRAVSKSQIQKVLSALDKGQPKHIHIAEQQIEIDQIQSYTGKRPVEFLYNHFNIDEQWCLIHATHLSDTEIQLITESKAVVGLCPLTEANLGDGIFPLPKYLTNKGAFAIGSDSHISISPFQELQTLEYSQRLNQQQRVIASSVQTQNVGEFLWKQALEAGARSCQLDVYGIKVGQRASWISLDTNHPLMTQLSASTCLDTAIFASHNFKHQSYVNGVKYQGISIEIQERYKNSLKSLR